MQAHSALERPVWYAFSYSVSYRAIASEPLFRQFLRSVERTNLFEEPDGVAPELEDDAVRFKVRPFEVLTLRVEPETE